MICAQCKKKEASVHFTGIINDDALRLDVCEDCAKKTGLTATFSFPSLQPALTDLMELLSSWQQKSSGASTRSACPVCRWTMAQFQKTGLMGCSECYLHFRTEAQNFLKKIHDSTVHKGKKAPTEVAKTKVREREKSLSRLKSELDRAIKDEKFELAATLRDKISAIENKPS